MYVYTSLYTYWLCQVDERDCRVRNFHHTKQIRCLCHMALLRIKLMSFAGVLGMQFVIQQCCTLPGTILVAAQSIRNTPAPLCQVDERNCLARTVHHSLCHMAIGRINLMSF